MGSSWELSGPPDEAQYAAIIEAFDGFIYPRLCSSLDRHRRKVILKSLFIEFNLSKLPLL